MPVPQPEVLIVGAGPTGLMMACLLSRLDVPFRIIDKNGGPTTQSRALVIQARSMEIFAQLGIAEEFVSRGLPAKALNFMVNGKIRQRVPLAGFGKGLTAFPYLLILEQAHTERILLDLLTRLGHDVEWHTELTELDQTDNKVTTTLSHVDGTTETTTVNWLVGADGAHSVVREQIGIPFGGKIYTHMLFVLDCKVSWSMPSGEMYTAFSREAFAAFFPMPDGHCRVGGILPPELEGRSDISFEDVNRDFAARLHSDVRLTDPRWIALYRAHHRYAAAFQKTRCFLAGDAAHIHSPVGAQGLNTGLQDAYNLAWKLAFVIQGKARNNLLSTYTTERLPIARTLVRTTDRAFSVTVNRSPLARIGPMYIAPILLPLAIKLPAIARLIFRTVSEIGIRYRQSPLSQHASRGRFPHHAPKPGDRLPYVLFEENGQLVNVQDKVDGTAFRLLVFLHDRSEALPDALERLTIQYQDVLSVCLIAKQDMNRQIHNTFGISDSGYYLVRPDAYIACRNNTRDTEHLKTYLASTLAYLAD